MTESRAMARQMSVIIFGNIIVQISQAFLSSDCHLVASQIVRVWVQPNNAGPHDRTSEVVYISKMDGVFWFL
jgi:hypothetical protein